MAGGVSSRGNRLDKVGTLVDEDAEISVTGTASRFVSRGGDKLDHALATFVTQGLEILGKGRGRHRGVDGRLHRLPAVAWG